MKLLILVVVALAASCGADISLLNNRQRQRPPQNAFQSSGGDFLQAPKNTYIPPNNNYLPPNNNYLPPSNNYLPPRTTTMRPPSTAYLPPETTTAAWQPPQTTAWQPPQTTAWQQPQNTYLPPNNNYLPPSGGGSNGGGAGGGNKGPTTPPVPILKQTQELNEDGSFKYEFLTGDQTHVEQMGHIENPGTDAEEQVMHGSYSYVGPDGVTYKVSYVADKDGFRAVGDHIPTPPPIPPEIQAALDANAAEEAQQQQGGYPSGPSQGYPSGPSQGYPSGPSQGYPSGPSQQGGYPSGRPEPTYLPPQQQKPAQPSFNPQTGYRY